MKSLMVCNVAGSLSGRSPDVASRIAAALIAGGLVGGTLALAYRSQSRSGEWLPLAGAFVVSFLLWWAARAMLAA